MNLLEVENLEVAFSIHGKLLRAVRGISFTVHEGEAVGIVGESGCGKSSAVQALMGLTRASEVRGTAKFRGENLWEENRGIPRSAEKFIFDKTGAPGLQQAKPVSKQPMCKHMGDADSCKDGDAGAVKSELVSRSRYKDIGMVFQDPMASLNPTMKIGDQIVEGLVYHKLCGKQEARRRAIELLQMVGVPEANLRMEQYPDSLSGGMRQRVLIAIAVACNPKLIIADEPTTALDVTISAQILDLFRMLQKRLKTALILITHDLHVVASICDWVLVMYAGKIVEQGSVEQVLNAPKHPYTKMLLQATARFDRPRTEKLTPIEGSPPNLFVQQKGCSFAPRCPFATDKCRAEEPVMKNGAACWYA